MSDLTKKFLAKWEFEHIEMVARSDREVQARRLALRCREDAAKAGISTQDLEAAADGNLTAICCKHWMPPSSGRYTATRWLTKNKIESWNSVGIQFFDRPRRREAAGWHFHVLTQIKAQAVIEAFLRLPT
jgi:hypothetical protein